MAQDEWTREQLSLEKIGALIAENKELQRKHDELLMASKKLSDANEALMKSLTVGHKLLSEIGAIINDASLSGYEVRDMIDRAAKNHGNDMRQIVSDLKGRSGGSDGKT